MEREHTYALVYFTQPLQSLTSPFSKTEGERRLSFRPSILQPSILAHFGLYNVFLPFSLFTSAHTARWNGRYT